MRILASELEVEEDEGPSFEAVHITMEVIHLPCID